MGLYEQIRDIAKIKGYSVNKLEQELGFARSSINKFNKNKPSVDKLQQIADFLEVSVDFLVTGKEPNKQTSIELNKRDHRDIKKSVDEIMTSLDKNNGETLYYDGVEVHLSDETKALLRNALTLTMQAVKLENKEKYNPHKNGK